MDGSALERVGALLNKECIHCVPTGSAATAAVISQKWLCVSASLACERDFQGHLANKSSLFLYKRFLISLQCVSR